MLGFLVNIAFFKDLLNPVYTIQPVWQPAVSCKQTSNRLSVGYRVERTAVRSTGCQTMFVKPVWQTRFDNRVERLATVRSTGCQTRLYNYFDNRLYTQYSRLSNGFDNRLNVCIHDTTGCHTGLTAGLTTGLTTGCIM